MSDTKQKRILMVLVIVTTAICLRAPITSVGSILYCIAEDLNLSNTIAGAITTIPLVVIACLSPFVSRIGEKFGLNQTLLLGMITMLVGLLLRSFGGFVGLLVGTALIGAGIACGNVLIPAIIKIFFPHKIGAMTGIFTTTMSICSGIGAGISVPLAVEAGWGWQLTFCIWAVMAVLAIAVNSIQLKIVPQPKTTEEQSGTGQIKIPLYKIPLVWSVVMLFGGQSCVFYMMVTWLPTIAVDRGISAVAAGGIAMVFQVTAIPANFLTPVIAGHIKDQRLLAVGITSLGVIGLIGIMFAGTATGLSVSAGILSLGLGGTFSLSLVIFGMRTNGGMQAARLSGFAQSAGYVMASVGPALAGWLYDISENWTLTIGLAIAIMVATVIAGTVAGADRKI